MPHCRISRTNAIWTDPTRRDPVSGQTSGAAGLRSKPQAVGSNSKENQPCFLELGLEDQQRARVRVVVADIKAHDFADPKSRGIQEGLIGNSNCRQFEIRGEYWPGCGGILNVASDLGRKRASTAKRGPEVFVGVFEAHGKYPHEEGMSSVNYSFRSRCLD